MLHLIVTGRAADVGRVRTVVLSAAAHAGLVLAALSARPATGVETSRRAMTMPPLERVRFIVAGPPRAESRSTAAAKPRRAAALVAPHMSALPQLTLSIPAADVDSIAHADGLDLTIKVSDSSDFSPRTLADAIGVALVGKRPSAAPANGVYTADAVDRIVTPVENPKPVYPPSLESRGVEADFTVRFVVDSTGRVDAGTLEVPREVHHLFADAVRYALMRSRFLPATIAGRPVRQIVAQEFIFRMPR